jgi:TPR repeat protein
MTFRFWKNKPDNPRKYMLPNRYQTQRGDYATAFREWLPLAEQGDALAQQYLGNMYATGRGVPEKR